MSQTSSSARRSTVLAISSYTTLRRRAVPTMNDIVIGYAEQLTRQIDREATP